MSEQPEAKAFSPLRDGVALWRTNVRLLTLEGRDRLRFLQAVVTQDVADLVPGEGRYAALADDRGHPISDFYLYAAADRVVLELPAERAEAVHAALARLIVADDVSPAWLSPGRVACESADPARLRAAVAGLATGAPLPAVEWFAHTGPALALDGSLLRASRLGAYGVSLPVPEAGIPGTVLDPGTVTRLEIEAGRPGAAELAEAKVVNELGIFGAVSFVKGCYVGQEILNRVRTRGQLQRRLTGVAIEHGGGAAWDGATLESPTGHPAGLITRAAFSPTLGLSVALGFVRQEHWAPGAALVARTRAAGETTLGETTLDAPARVSALPFVHVLPPQADPAPFVPREAS